jgi:hypothetical protein
MISLTRHASRRPLRLLGCLAAILTICSVPGLLGAEIFKCTGPDGKMIFTSDAHRCPNAKPHVSKGQVQAVTVTSPAARRSLRSSMGGGDTVDGFESMWRDKRGKAERELDNVSPANVRLQSMVVSCARGATWVTKDDAGLKRKLSCDEIRARHAAASQREQELREYLDQGLAEECRKAGCLPGWIR